LIPFQVRAYMLDWTMPKLVQSVKAEPAPLGKGRLLASLTLLEWGTILIYFYCSGRLGALLDQNFHPLVLITGVLLGISSALLWCRDETDSEPEPDCGCCEHSHEGVSLGRLLAFLVLMAPIALAAMISPDGYGSVMVRNRGISETVERAASGTPPMLKSEASPSDEPAVVEVGDLIIAAQSPAGMAQYDGKRVALLGQFCSLGDKQFEVVRMLMLCCAADAQVLVVRAEADKNPDLKPMQWVTVAGRVSFVKKGGREVPFLAAERVTPAPEPADRYVHRGGTLQSVPPGHFKLQLPPH